jgi:hypothetical protein
MKIEQISVKIDVETITLVKKVSKARGEQLSDFVRRSVRMELVNLGYLGEAEKKALGIEDK